MPSKLLLIFLLLLSFLVRLYKFDAPIADWHSWRQVDTSSVSREFIKQGFDVLHPHYHDFSDTPSGRDNPQGYRFVEFPLYNLAQAGLFSFVGVFTLEEWGRLISIFSSLLGSVFLYGLLRRHYSERIALLTVGFYGLLPFAIYYHRTVLPDTAMVTAVLGAIYFFDSWLLTKKVWWYILSLILSITALLLKPYSLFFLLPIVVLAFQEYKSAMVKNLSLWLFFILSVGPLLWWRLWMVQFPEGIPFSAWLFNEGNIRFKGAYFYWLFGERIGKLIFGYWLGGIFLLGVLRRFPSKSYMLGISFLLASILYMSIIARGNVQHDYYQILILPSLSLYLGVGIDMLLELKGLVHRYIVYATVGIVCILSFSLSWYYVRDYFIVNQDMVTAGRRLDILLPKNAKVLTLQNGDTTFLYQMNRSGWPSAHDTLDVLAKKGADYLVLLHPSVADLAYAKGYPLFAKEDGFVVFSLRSH